MKAALFRRINAARGSLPPALLHACFAVAVLNLAFFPAAWIAHAWIFDEAGRGIPTDFINVWSAGRFALEGQAPLAYDWDVQKQLQIAILGQDFPGHAAWHYPPPFLFVAAALALLPYGLAYALWPLISFVPFAIVLRAIVGRPFGWLLALGFPLVLTNTLIGQNGFLTAALVGGTLYLMPSRPVLAGLCLGLLSYKPQYGVLFPLVLIAAAQWRTIASAAVTVIVLVAASSAVFGIEAWQQWLHWLPMASQAFLSEGRVPWGKMQSIFTTIRYFGGPEQLAWVCQYVLIAAVALALIALWRSRARYELKAAALATGALLATPYLFIYDVMILSVPIAFLINLGWREGFLRHELPVLGFAGLLLFVFPVLMMPTGFAATLVVAVAIARRCGVFGARHAMRANSPAATLSP
jgi:hypothetical protein